MLPVLRVVMDAHHCVVVRETVTGLGVAAEIIRAVYSVVLVGFLGGG